MLRSSYERCARVSLCMLDGDGRSYHVDALNCVKDWHTQASYLLKRHMPVSLSTPCCQTACCYHSHQHPCLHAHCTNACCFFVIHTVGVMTLG